MNMRIGQGWDVHRLAEDRQLIIGGVLIPHERGLFGHSDADVLLHAIIDALLGAAGLGDIGAHFPDTSATFAGANSRELLRAAYEEVQKAGWAVANLDSTVIAQRPRLAPYIPAMRHNIAEDLAVEVGAINVKAKTSEKIGYLGREEGIAAEAVCLLTRI